MRRQAWMRMLRVIGIALLPWGAGQAQAGYFVNALASSPLATYLFGDVDKHAASNATSTTIYFDGNADEVFAQGMAAADLSTGALHSRATAQLGYLGACPNCNSLFPIGNANFGDSFTFLGSFTGQTVTFHAQVAGTWSGTCGTSCVGPGAATFQLLVLPAGSIDQHSSNEFDLFSNAANQLNVGPNASLPLAVDVSRQLFGTNPTLDFAADLDIFGLASTVGQTFDGNFSHTAAFSFTAPAGVTVVSASGLFPGTISAARLPEPPMLACLLAALVAAGTIRRRSRPDV